MAFQLQGWNPGGMSLTYRPQTVNLPVQPGATTADRNFPLVGGVPKPAMPPPAVAPGLLPPDYGMYQPGTKLPGLITPKDDMVSGLDKLMKTVGALGMRTDAPGNPIDANQAALWAGLAKGKGAGTGKTQKINESIISSILSLGSGQIASGRDKGNNKGNNKGGGGNKGVSQGSALGILGALGGGMPVEKNKGGKNKKGKGKRK